jgi:hypothetical protein
MMERFMLFLHLFLRRKRDSFSSEVNVPRQCETFFLSHLFSVLAIFAQFANEIDRILALI